MNIMKIELSKTLRSVILLHALIFICGSVSSATIDEIRGLWDIGSLKKTPSFRDAALKEDGVKGIFIEGLPCKGRKTEFFAWYGIPKNASGKVPGIILLHGSGLTANVEWVRIWNDKGYAAIAIDYDGCIPVANVSGSGGWTYHKWGGPCHAAQFDQANLDLKNQWFYHAVANAIQAHSFLLSRPEVDPEQTGLTGISWGAQLALIVSGLDGRYKFTVPVYASGFLDESSHWTETIKKLGPEFNILLDASIEELKSASLPEIAEGIIKVREGKVIKEPGYDGVFGKIKIFGKERETKTIKQKMLF